MVQLLELNSVMAYAPNQIAWDPTVPIALNAAFQQSRWRMSQYAGENRLHPRVAGFMLSWERRCFPQQGSRNSWETACFPWIKGHQTPPSLLISLFCFYDNWGFKKKKKKQWWFCWRRWHCCCTDSRRGFLCFIWVRGCGFVRVVWLTVLPHRELWPIRQIL